MRIQAAVAAFLVVSVNPPGPRRRLGTTDSENQNDFARFRDAIADKLCRRLDLHAICAPTEIAVRRRIAAPKEIHPERRVVFGVRLDDEDRQAKRCHSFANALKALVDPRLIDGRFDQRVVG